MRSPDVKPARHWLPIAKRLRQSWWRGFVPKIVHGWGRQPPINPKGSLAIIGMLADNAEFSRTMDEIIAGPSKRYGFEE